MCLFSKLCVCLHSLSWYGNLYAWDFFGVAILSSMFACGCCIAFNLLANRLHIKLPSLSNYVSRFLPASMRPIGCARYQTNELPDKSVAVVADAIVA
jgi:hypothetical protein